MDAGELRLTDIPRRYGGFLAVSQSGETRDLMKALKHAELAGVARLSVVNSVGSAIARETVRGVFALPGYRSTSLIPFSRVTPGFRRVRTRFCWTGLFIQ